MTTNDETGKNVGIRIRYGQRPDGSTGAEAANEITKEAITEALDKLFRKATSNGHVVIPESIEIGPSMRNAYGDPYGRGAADLQAQTMNFDTWEIQQPGPQQAYPDQ